MSYTDSELLVLDTDFRTISQKLTQHFQSCGDCFLSHHEGDHTSCELTFSLFTELSSIAEILGRDVSTHHTTDWYYFSLSPAQAEEKAIRDFMYEQAVADYVTTDKQVERWPVSPDEHFAEIQDAWLTSAEGRRCVAKNDVDDSQEVVATNMAHLASLGYFTEEPDPIATSANLKAHCRIWTTNRGQVAFYRTFIQRSEGNLKSGSFYAYCADCRKGFTFAHQNRHTLFLNLFRVMRHAHTHVPDSTLSFYGEHFSISGSDSTSASTDWLIHGLKEDLARFEVRQSYGIASDREIALADEYRNVLEYLTR